MNPELENISPLQASTFNTSLNTTEATVVELKHAPTNDTIEIHYDNLCYDNDFRSLTNNYDRCKIRDLIWSINDKELRTFVNKAIQLQQKMDNNPNDDVYWDLQEKQLELEKQCSAYLEKNVKHKIDISEKSKGYNATEFSVYMYFLLDGLSVNARNVGEKTCTQSNLAKLYSKASGMAERSFEGKITLDFTKPAVRTAMEKVANDLRDICPEISKEIMHQYNEYEDDYYEKYPQKRKKLVS